VTRVVIVFIFFLLYGCVCSNQTDLQSKDSDLYSGRPLSYDELSELRSRLQPLVLSANFSYAGRQYSINLPDRIQRFGPDYFSPQEIFELEKSGLLPESVSDILYQTILEHSAGFFKLDEVHRSWITHRPDWVRLWWKHAKEKELFKSFGNMGVDIRPDEIYIERRLQDKLYIPNSKNYNTSTNAMIYDYFREKQNFLGGDGLISPSEYLPILRQKDGWLKSNINKIDKAIVFKAPSSLQSDWEFCTNKVKGNSEQRSKILNQFAKDNKLQDDELQLVRIRCFDVSYMANYDQQTAGDYYSTLLEQDPNEFVYGELFSYSTKEGRGLVSNYYRQILVNSLDKLKESIDENHREKIRNAFVIITPEDEQHKPNFLFHAATAVGPSRIRLSPAIVRAAAAQCRAIQVKAIQSTNGIKSYQERQRALNRADRGNLYQHINTFRQVEQDTKELVGFSSVENQPAKMHEASFLYNEIDWTKLFESCVGGNLSLLLAHELAHLYMIDSTEEKRYCAALIHLDNELELDTYRGLDFLKNVMLNAVERDRNELWNWDAEDSGNIRGMFENLTDENCKNIDIFN
jgi:hypothetical protein